MNVPRDFGPSTQPTVSELDRDLLHGGARVGGCVIIEPLSQDDGGIVYVADDPVLRRRVLIREHFPLGLAARGPKGEVVLISGTQAGVRASALEAFLRGARLLDRFDHPAIARVHRVWEEQGTAYLMSPFHEGSPLGAYLHRQTEPPGEAWLRALLGPLLGALETLHAAGVFHLGLSPESIWLTGDERPVLIDLSSSVERGHAAGPATDSVDRLYAPLELFSHGREFPVGPWTDLYGVAAVLHQALLGRPPMSAAVLGPADEHAPLAEGLLRRPGAKASALPSASFLRAIDQALSVRPEHRPQSVAAFRQLMGLADELHTVLPAAAVTTAASPQSVAEPAAAPAVEPVAAPAAAPVAPKAAATRAEPDAPREPDVRVDDDPSALDGASEPEIDEAASAAIALAMSSLTWTDRREPVLPGLKPRPMPQPAAKAASSTATPGASRAMPAAAGPLPGRSAQREPGFGSASARPSAAPAGAVPSWVLPGPGKRRKPQAMKRAGRGRRVQVLAGLLVGFATLSVAGWYAKDSPQAMAWVQPWLNEVGLRPTVAGPAVVAESPSRETTPAPQPAADADPAALLAQDPTAAGPPPGQAAASAAVPALAPAPAAVAPVPPAVAEPAAVPPPPARLSAKERAAARAAERAAARAAAREQAAERAAARAAERAAARDAERARAAERTAARDAERARAAAAVPATPRAACGTRTNFALFRCMETQCNLGRYSRHPQCIQFRQDGDV